MPVNIMPENEGVLVADHACRLELGGDAAGGVSGMEKDENLASRLAGSENRPGEPAGRCQQRYEDEPKQLAHNEDSLDDRGDWQNLFAARVLTLVRADEEATDPSKAEPHKSGGAPGPPECQGSRVGKQSKLSFPPSASLAGPVYSNTSGDHFSS